MSDNLDVTDGVASFVSARFDAWHKMGITVDSDKLTGQQVLELGRLGGWKLRRSGLFTMDGDMKIDVSDQYAILRNNPVNGKVESLGVVGKAYKIIQNERLVALLEAIIHETGAIYDTAGALDGGRRVFVTLKLPQGMTVGGIDAVDLNLIITTSHDGSASIAIMISPTRVVCANTLRAAFRNNVGIYKVPHLANAEAAILREARQALELSWNYLNEFQTEAEKLIETELTETRFEEIIRAEFGAPEGAPKPTVTRCDNKINSMLQLFTEAETQAGIRNTAWAGFNSLTEWFDHLAPVRPGDGDEELKRAERAAFDTSFPTRALELMLAEV